MREVFSHGARSPKRARAVAPKKVSVSEPTPEMIDAGVAVLWASGAVEGQLGSDELLVSEIFQAMCQSAPSRSR